MERLTGRALENIMKNWGEYSLFEQLMLRPKVGYGEVAMLPAILEDDKDGSISKAFRAGSGQEILDALAQILEVGIEKDTALSDGSTMGEFYLSKNGNRKRVQKYIRRLDPKRMSVNEFFGELLKINEMCQDL